MLRYFITDRQRAGGLEPLIEAIGRNLAAGVDLVQIREKDLSARQLAELVRQVLEMHNPWGTQILVNGRVDVALACGAHGVHLPADSIPPYRIRVLTPAEFEIGVSCHTVDEVCQAACEGADFVVFGPVFSPLSKTTGLPPRELELLSEAAHSVKIPVLALGGITAQNAAACVDAGAAGVAGISLFQ